MLDKDTDVDIDIDASIERERERACARAPHIRTLLFPDFTACKVPIWGTSESKDGIKACHRMLTLP